MAKHNANMNINKQIQEISQSEPEQEKSFFGAPHIGCGADRKLLPSKSGCVYKSSSATASKRSSDDAVVVTMADFKIISLILSV